MQSRKRGSMSSSRKMSDESVEYENKECKTKRKSVSGEQRSCKWQVSRHEKHRGNAWKRVQRHLQRELDAGGSRTRGRRVGSTVGR